MINIKCYDFQFVYLPYTLESSKDSNQNKRDIYLKSYDQMEEIKNSSKIDSDNLRREKIKKINENKIQQLKENLSNLQQYYGIDIYLEFEILLF